MNFHTNFLDHRKKTTFYISLLFLIVLALTIFTQACLFIDDRLKSDLIMTSIFLMTYFYSIGIIFQFVCPVIACRDRMRTISSRISLKFRLNSYEIQNYVQLYRRLMKIVEDINKHLTMPLIPIFTYFFVTITFEFYSVVRLIFKNSDFKLFLGVFSTLWSLLYLLPFLIVIYAADSAMIEIDKIKDVGFDALCCQKIFDAHSEIIFNFFLSSIDRSRLQFQTIFFHLDWHLFFKVSLATCAHSIYCIYFFSAYQASQCSLSSQLNLKHRYLS